MPVTWLKDGKPLSASEVEMKADGPVLSLHIPSTVLDDEAEYAVMVGKTQSKAELLVDGKIISLLVLLLLFAHYLPSYFTTGFLIQFFLL